MKSSISLFKPSRSPYWYLQWVDEDGRKRQKSTDRKEKSQALQVLTDLKNFTKEKKKPLLFSKFAAQFEGSCEGTISRSTMGIYSSTFSLFLRLVGDLSLLRITPLHWDLFKSARLQEVNAVRCNIELRTLRASLSTAVRWGIIENNPFSRQQLCSVPEMDAPFLTVQQFRTIEPLIMNRDVRDTVIIAFNTGMRLGEIISLKWANVDFVSGVIHIHNSANFKTKTGKQRTIPMNIEVLRTLKRRKEGLVNEAGEIFQYSTGDYISKQFKKTVRQALGKKSPIHFHSLRHSFCSNLLRAGANVRVVQTLAGHSSMATTEKYLHNVSSDAHIAVELLSSN